MQSAEGLDHKSAMHSGTIIVTSSFLPEGKIGIRVSGLVRPAPSENQAE